MSSAAQQALVRVASRREVHAALQFLHLQEPRFRDWHERLVQIPAPTFHEGERAAALAEIFRGLGYRDVRADNAGNVLCVMPGGSSAVRVLVCAHLDTVFSPETRVELRRDGVRILAPGAADNGAGLAAMLALAAALQAAAMQPACEIVFAGSVGEEGEGNLRGMREMFASEWSSNVRAVVALDGPGHSAAVTQALGSRRLEIEITGPGGHSWNDAGRPNPIAAMARAITAVEQQPVGDGPAAIVNFASIGGGGAINAIPANTQCRVDIRSIENAELIRLEDLVRRAFAEAVAYSAQHPAGALALNIRPLGERPSGTLDDASALAVALAAVDRHLQITTHRRTASTDANVPLSLGVPAISIGGGGSGGDSHTLQEWYDPRGRELALRRALLVLLTVAELLAESSE
jgi:tripeptide aminopeptidase